MIKWAQPVGAGPHRGSAHDLVFEFSTFKLLSIISLISSFNLHPFILPQHNLCVSATLERPSCPRSSANQHLNLLLATSSRVAPPLV